MFLADSYINLWTSPSVDSDIVNKAKNPISFDNIDYNSEEVEKLVLSKKTPYEDKIRLVTNKVLFILNKWVDNVEVITTKEELRNYLDCCVENNLVAIDTETNNSLDPLTCKIMGLCLYTPNKKPAYIPINHCDFKTKSKLKNQLSEIDIKNGLEYLISKRNNQSVFIFHNYKFDYQVLKCTCDVKVPCDWDTMLAVFSIDENEIGHAGLKEQYITKIDNTQQYYNIEKLFKGVKYEDVEPSIFALYSAVDAYMTYKLWEHQFKILHKEENKSSLNVFLTIEMPLVEVVAEMELTGIHIDTEYAKRLHQKYQSKLDDIDKKIDEELNKLAPTIEKWRQSPDANVSIKGGKTKNQQLTNPINFSSPLQVAIIFYDILKVPVINKKQPRSTDKATLDIIAERYDIPLAKLKKERAAIKILLDTFIDKLPTNINVKDNKLHCEFNQYGAVTGRFSSSSPNLQNIPSHAYDIRKMFVPSKNNVFVGSDYSGQEIRLMAALSNSKSMKQALKEGKDLYVVIAQQIYHNNYEDNLEFYPEGTILEIDGKKTVCGKNYVNIEGKKRRGVAKMINLAILYGMGPNLLSKKIESTYQEAQSILNNFFKEFPDVKTFIDNTQQKAKTLYYVEDFMGRRRHLRELTLSPYEAKYKDTDKMLKENFNPLLICSSKKLDTSLLDKYLDKCKNLKNPSEFSELSKNASQEGVILTSNQSTIAMAERQAVNFVVQGSAASLTKMAMVDIAKDKILNDLGFKLVLTIHDEVIGECPKENAEEVGKRLSYLMVNASHNLLDVPFKCDAEISNYWGEEVLESSVKKDYETLLSKMSQQEAFQKLCDIHSEFLPNQLKELVDIFN